MIQTFRHGDPTRLSAHFSAAEFQCKCGQPHDFLVSDALISHLELLHEALNCKSIHVSSGFRCAKHDRAVGGTGSGKHTQGLAADVICYGQDGKPVSSKIVSCKAQDLGFTGIANITASYTSTHLDMRQGKKWYGDETKGTAWGCADLHQYYKIPKEENQMSEKAKKGIDLSYCQKKVDWEKVTAEFAIIRAGYGRYAHQKDSMFESHYAGAQSRGIPVGAYWYSYAMTPEDARLEADACIAVLKGKQFAYPIYYDVEEKKQFELGKEQVSAIIRAFLERLEAAGYWVGLYSSYSALTAYVAEDIRKRYSIWLAHWDVQKSPYQGAYGLWQYAVGQAEGVSGDCDLDYGYVDYPAQIRAKGLNGFAKPDAPDVPDVPDKPDSIAVQMTLNGKQYSGTLTAK